MRALVIESDSHVRGVLRDGLAGQGYKIDVADNGEDGLWLALQHRYTIIILNARLLAGDGLAIVRHLREQKSSVPLLLVANGNDAADRVAGLDAGADDVLPIPFASAELYARVRALVRRPTAVRDTLLRVDDMVIDTARRTVVRGEERIALSQREYALLEYLASRADQLVTRSDIWQHVYEFQADARSNVVDVYISYLRKKLGEPDLIHTLRGSGYRFGARPS